MKIHGNSLDEFQEQLPEFHLEDKVDFKGGRVNVDIKALCH